METLIGIIITNLALVIVAVINSRQNKRIKDEVVVVKDKVDNVHSEVNGKMQILLDTTKELGKAQGKAEEKLDSIDEGVNGKH